MRIQSDFVLVQDVKLEDVINLIRQGVIKNATVDFKKDANGLTFSIKGDVNDKTVLDALITENK